MKPQPRIPGVRGHRHVGGQLGHDERERHWIVAAIAAVAAIASAYTAYSSAQYQAGSAEYQQKVARNQAQAARDAAAAASADQAEQDQRILAAQRAVIGASGSDPSYGAPLLVQADSAATAELNRRRILWQGEQGARNYETDAILRGWEARASRRQGYVAAGSSLLQAAGYGYSSYRQYNAGGGGGAGGRGY